MIINTLHSRAVLSDLEPRDIKISEVMIKRKMEVYYLAEPAVSLLDRLVCSAYSIHLSVKYAYMKLVSS